jgi:hypothetical protein
VDSNFIFDYALVFKSPGGFVRIDVTIIPKVYRNGGVPEASAFLCRPDGNDMPFPSSPAVSSYIPHPGACSAGGRDAPYALINSTYAGAHPEEEAWLRSRLDKTAPKVQSFVRNKISMDLNDTEARLKIAVVHSGGGKRAMLQSLGACIPCVMPCCCIPSS